MSDYTLAVSWSGKDALADSDAGKVISGSDFNSEFTTIQTALNSKADIASETLTGIPLAPTAVAGTDTTQIATTAFVQASANAAVINNLVYPVGSIYFNMAVATNPATLLGMGTWAAYGEGRVLVGYQSSGTFDALDESLGAETASTGSHTLATSEMPSHTHGEIPNSAAPFGPYHTTTRADGNQGAWKESGATGGGGAHTHSSGSTLQPSVTVYIWKRTA
jgi:hypothetical protein